MKKKNWDTETANKCRLPDLIPGICEGCRDRRYCEAKKKPKQIGLFEEEE